MIRARLAIRKFEWDHWRALWILRSQQLAENGISVDVLPEYPDYTSPYEQDYHRIAQIYLRGAGSFWLAWYDQIPVGHIGAQSIDQVIELRRMYVSPAYRRRGIGTALVATLIRHCAAKDVRVIELWTAENGPGRRLYEKFGFRSVGAPGDEFGITACPPGEIRMRLDQRTLSRA